MKIKILALALLPIASLNATQWYQSIAEKVAETVSPYKKEAAIATGVAGTFAIGYKLINCYKQAQQKELFDKLLQSKEGKKYFKLIKRIKNALECRIQYIIECQQKLIRYNQRISNTQMIENNNNILAEINECLSELSPVINTNIFNRTTSTTTFLEKIRGITRFTNPTKVEILKDFAENNCCDYNSIDDYKSIKEDLKSNNAALKQVVISIEQNLEHNREKFSVMCAKLTKHLNSLQWI